MSPQHTYHLFRRWAVVVGLLLFAHVARAQSDADSVLGAFDRVEDTISASTQVNDSITFRSTPDSAIGRLQAMKEFAYANDPEYWTKKEEEEKPRTINTGWIAFWQVFQLLMFGVFIVVLIYILIKILSNSKIILFKRKSKTIERQEEEEVVEEMDLSGLIRKAETESQYRLAARYRYMQLLENLNSRQLIKMHGELTNWDYVRQLSKHPLAPKFRYLTLAYDYVWYGEFELGNDQYMQLKNKFETFFH